MDKKRILDMVSMRLDGATFQEIGDAHGITSNGARSAIMRSIGLCDKPKKSIERIVYPAIRNWLTEHQMSKRKFSSQIGVSVAHVTNILNGKVNPTIKIANKILSVTGLTYEEAFRREDMEVSP